MFSRKPHQSDSFSSKYRAGKSSSNTKAKRSFRDHATSAATTSTAVRRSGSAQPKPRSEHTSPPIGSTLTSAIYTICVGPEQRLFAAHEDVLSLSPFFASHCRGQFLESGAKRIDLPEEQAEIFSTVLEYLYKGDYYPRLIHNRRRDVWELEDAGTNNGGRGAVESTVYHHGVGGTILKDTVVYCAAEKYNLPELKRLALRKQGLQSGIQCSTILSSARYAYSNTPDSDSKLRAHYLALIIRSRGTFKRSGTMQAEMEMGGQLFFDLFVAMCNHMDDIVNVRSPRT